MKSENKVIFEYMTREVKKSNLFTQRISMIKSWIDKMDIEEKKEYLLKAGIVKKLNIDQTTLREKLLKIIDRHGDYDTSYCNCKICLEEIQESTLIMKDIIKTVRLLGVCN